MIFQVDFVIIMSYLISFLFLTLNIGFFAYFLKKYLDTKHKMFRYLTVLFLTFLFRNIFQFGVLIFDSTEFAVSCFILREIFDMLVLYSLIVLLEVFEKDVSFSTRQSIMTILVFMAIGAMLSTPTFVIDENNPYGIKFGNNELIGGIQLIFYIVAGIWLSIMLYQNHKTAWSVRQKKLILWLSLGVFCAIFFPFISYLIIIIEAYMNSPLMYISIGTLPLVRNLGIIFIGIAFLKASKEPWLLQRHRIHFLIVYSKDGIQLFSKVFNEKLTSERTMLLAGGFSAITSIFKEATETTGSIKSIVLEDKELQIINNPHFLCAILVDFSTQASEIAHNNFASEFELKFKEELELFNGEVSKFSSAEEIIKKYFS